MTRAQWLSMVFVALAFATAAVLYPTLPASVPVHWNARGVADGFAAKPWGPFLLPLLTAGVFALLQALPRLSPRGYAIDKFASTYQILQAAIVGVVFSLSIISLVSAKLPSLPVDRLVLFAVGTLFVILGNFLGKVTRNFFVGIRTPWTLSSEEVWLRTHRLGGKLFVIGGLLVMGSAVFGLTHPAILLATIALIALVPAGYSYFISRRPGVVQ